jgi:uncharacterized repeat protein (TIGR03803 family)
MRRDLLLPILLFAFSYSLAGQADDDFRIVHTFEDKPATNSFPVVFGPGGVAFGASGGGNTTCSPGNGCGTVYSLSQDKDGQSRFEVIYLFNEGEDGWLPSGKLLVDSNTNLYGTTWFGGSSPTYCYDECGTIFELTQSQDHHWTRRILHRFTGYDGQTPIGGLIPDAFGNLYGLTMQGGTNDAGTVFELRRDSDGTWSESVLHNFSGTADGACPVGPLAFDKEWNLYGVTSCGGTYDQGTVFKLTRHSNRVWSETVLYSFGAFIGDGELPIGGPVLDKDGNVFGTTSSGGTRGGGVAFELSKQADGTWAETIIHDFLGGDDGSIPSGPVAIDPEGNLYGTTRLGGNSENYGYGTLFELTLHTNTGWSETILHSFSNEDDGQLPNGGVTLKLNGSHRGIYGSAAGGAAGYGVDYEFRAF